MTQKILHIRFVLESENVQLFERESRNAKIKNQIHMHCESLSRGFCLYLLIVISSNLAIFKR